jgi:AraC-like DNA-binding protein
MRYPNRSTLTPGGRRHDGPHAVVPTVANGEPPNIRRTQDVDEAQEILSKEYRPVRLSLPAGSTGLVMELTGLHVGVLTAGLLSFGRALRVLADEAQNFHVNVPITGGTISRKVLGPAVTFTRGQAAVFSPGDGSEILWSADCSQLCLMVPRVTLEGELELLLGRSLREELRFDLEMGPVGPLRRRWQSGLNLLLDELIHPSGITEYLAAGRHIEGMVMDGLLLTHPHNYTDALTRSTPAGAVGPTARAVRRAIELMEERPAEPWTTARLAREVHLSIRSLQQGFSRDLELSPTAYLRHVRLRRVRESLERASKDVTTVQAVAAGFGFLHMGRFAAAYRNAFGETPVETLRRPPGP